MLNIPVTMAQYRPPSKDKFLYIETFGCQMNASDSGKIEAMLQDIGYITTEEPSMADLIILNTCSVRAKAERKVYGHLGRFKGLKSANKRLIIGVGGCVAQQEGERLLHDLPFLDIVFGTHNLHLLPEMVRGAERGERRAEVAFLDNGERLDLFPSAPSPSGVTAFVTIMQGCDNFCSYCIVPYVRGQEISRRSGDIINEIRDLADNGVKEVTLLGQNVNSYGLKSSGELDFPALLKEVAAIDRIERVRFVTSHPKDISPALIDCFAELPKLCGHMHLPAQSGSDRILEMMNRGYTRREYLEKAAALKSVRPQMQITGDIIVGFPGETEEDFLQTLSLMEEADYADLFYFAYSSRPETRASGYHGHLSEEEKQGRLLRLQELQTRMTKDNNQRLVGTRQKVLVEGRSRRGDQLHGRTDGNRAANFDGDGALVGKIVEVEITEALKNSLLGKLC